MRTSIVTAALLILSTVSAYAQSPSGGLVDSLRGPVPIMETTTPPPLVNQDNSDVRRARSYAMQPPIIPHKVESYQIDTNANRCMFCHARTRTEESQAPMISVTHFQDREANFLAELSPRRYFCLQCHVPQAPVNTLVENHFVDVDILLRRAGSPSATLREEAP
ncbi:MAG TPA: nitrate reductase cytochrome c-type subunit [Azoarcus sp.]|nr:nitrate reductase cytochrome c-type subunit [Azoarcus sp.]